MADTTPTPTPTPTPEPEKTKRTRSAVNQAHAAELSLAGELAATAAKEAYASALADEGIDAAFLTAVKATIAEGDALMASATGKTADKKSITQREDDLKQALLELIDKVQTRAKRKYKPGDPMREKYFIGERIDANRATLERGTRAILQSLAADTLPGMKPAETTALNEALAAYLGVQSEQSGGQSGATTDRDLLGAKVKEVADLRRQIQYAADTIWPASKKANAGIRAEFKLSPDRAMK